MTHDSAVRAPAQFDDSQLDRLESLLEDPALPDAMRLDEIQGYLCAALAGPQPIPEDDWITDVLGGDDALDSDAGRQAAALLRAFTSALEAELAAGEPPVLLLYPSEDAADAADEEADDDAPSDYQPWCQAYLAGVDSAAEDWFEYLGEGEEGDALSDEASEEIEYLDQQLFPLMVLTGEAEDAARENGEEWPEGIDREQLEEDCREDLPQAVADIYRFWLAKRGTAPIRRETPKVGRNDPCPCSSGKKFKQCCGAQD